MSAVAEVAYRPIGLAGSVLAGAALQGPVFAMAKAALDPRGAPLFERAIGAWPRH